MHQNPNKNPNKNAGAAGKMANTTKNARGKGTQNNGNPAGRIKNPFVLAGVAAGIILIIALVLFGINRYNQSFKKNNSIDFNSSSTSNETTAKTGSDFDAKKDIVVIEMESGGIIKIELYPEQAPITVKNFVKLVNEGFYDGLKFHRVIKGFMIQGGDPKGTGSGGSSATIKGEFASNGVNNTISHTRGVISMARSTGMNTASSQFFIMHKDNASLDGDYAAFGKVIEGMDVVDTIAAVKCDNSNPKSPVPLVPQIMKEVRIETRAG